MVKSLVRFTTFSSSMKTLQLLEAASGKGSSTVAVVLRRSVFEVAHSHGGARRFTSLHFNSAFRQNQQFATHTNRISEMRYAN